jgi:hypothetical protein
MKAKENAGSGFEQPRPGVWQGVCYKVVDIGTQEETYAGESKQQRKFYIFWEIAQLMGDGRPFSVSCKFTLSLHKKSTLRPFLEAWRGKAFSEAELKDGFHLKKLLGAQCLLALVQTDDQKYTNVSSAIALQEGTSKMPVSNALVYFSLESEEFDPKIFDALPEWLKKKIVTSPEYKVATGQTSHASAGADEDIPF